MAPFATLFRSGGLAPLIFDRAANPDGLAPEVKDGVVRLAVQRGAFGAASAGEPDRCDRCELREPGKLPLGVVTRHGFVLRLSPGFPRVRCRFVAAQLKVDDGGSPLFALRVEGGMLFADWRVPGLAVEHHGIAAEPHAWTRYDLTVGPAGGELAVDGRRVSRLRHDLGAAGRKYLKVGPYRDKHPDWGAGPAAVEICRVDRSILTGT